MEARLLDDRADACKRLLDRRVEKAHPPRRGLGQPEQHPYQGCLAGAVRSEEAEDLAALHREVDRVHRGALAEALRETLGLDDVWGG